MPVEEVVERLFKENLNGFSNNWEKGLNYHCLDHEIQLQLPHLHDHSKFLDILCSNGRFFRSDNKIPDHPYLIAF